MLVGQGTSPGYEPPTAFEIQAGLYGRPGPTGAPLWKVTAQVPAQGKYFCLGFEHPKGWVDGVDFPPVLTKLCPNERHKKSRRSPEMEVIDDRKSLVAGDGSPHQTLSFL